MEKEYSPVLDINLFPQNLKEFKYSGDIQPFLDKIYQIKSEYKNEGDSSKHTHYVTPYFLDQKYPEFIPLRNELIKIVELNYQFKCHVADMWGNVYSKDEYNSYHNHEPYPLVGVMFLQTPPTHPGIMFHDKNIPSHNYTVNPTPGSILLFSGYLSHQSPPNPLDEDKISIAFNLEKLD
jgi:hypothetical protein